MSVKARRWATIGWDKIYIVRAEIRYDGNAPSERMDTRYFRMQYSRTGWRVIRDTEAWLYHTSFFWLVLNWLDELL